MPVHAERRLLAYLPEQLFDLVADVGKYPQFLPWCVSARVRSRTEALLLADLTVGFGPFRETFGSRVELDAPKRIKVTYQRGPFRYLNNHWDFIADPKGCVVDFFVDFEFRSRILQAAVGVVFHEATKRMVNAFERRARQVYGPTAPSVAPSSPATASE
jgi:coenzyme Q-binding protein COQ10